jgi:5-methylcytosine-specific restriction endonuclease McrA
MRENSHKRGYNKQWERARLAYLKQHPLCVMCSEQGRVVAASVVDHIKPHKGDTSLFWNKNNWQSLCSTHHNSTKQRMENQGITIGCDERGMPIDANHHWKT